MSSPAPYLRRGCSSWRPGHAPSCARCLELVLRGLRPGLSGGGGWASEVPARIHQPLAVVSDPGGLATSFAFVARPMLSAAVRKASTPTTRPFGTPSLHPAVTARGLPVYASVRRLPGRPARLGSRGVASLFLGLLFHQTGFVRLVLAHTDQPLAEQETGHVPSLLFRPAIGAETMIIAGAGLQVGLHEAA